MEENMEAREDLILGLAALSGDFPIKLIHLLPGSMGWTKKIIHTLAADQLIKRHLKNGVKSLRLTKKGRDVLTHAFPDRFLPIFTDAYLSRCRKSDPASLERIHRAAAVYTLMQQAGARIYPDEKPALFSAVDTPAHLRSPCFYTSLEVKARGTELTRIQATRAAGVLLGRQREAYLVYNTGATPLKWSSKAEQKLMGAVKGILLDRHVPMEEVRGLMIGNGMDTALDLLRSAGGKRRQNFRPDGTFTAFHYAPCDKEGIQLTRLLCCPPARVAFAKRMFGKNSEASRTPRFDCDAVQDGKAVLFAWEFDMERLRRYRNGLELFGESGIVFCFDYQADCLSAYFGELAQVRPLDAGRTYRELENDGL